MIFGSEMQVQFLSLVRSSYFFFEPLGLILCLAVKCKFNFCHLCSILFMHVWICIFYKNYNLHLKVQTEN